MISANVLPSFVPREWAGGTNRTERFDWKPLEGAWPMSLGDKAVVVVRKSGVAAVIKRKYARGRCLLGDRPYKLGDDFYYLTPVGKVKEGGDR